MRSRPICSPARAYLTDARQLGIPLPLSINQEAHLPTAFGRQLSVPDLVDTVGGYRRLQRHRHWLHQGYVEELYALDPRMVAGPLHIDF